MDNQPKNPVFRLIPLLAKSSVFTLRAYFKKERSTVDTQKKSRFILLFPIGILLLITLAMSWHFLEKKFTSPLYIAVVAPMSGNGQKNGESMIEGIQLYLDNINDQGGIHNRQIKMLIFDDKNQTDLAIEHANTIVAHPDILLVIGHYSSATSLAAMPIYKNHGIPAISASATADQLTTDKDGWYFRTIFNNSDQGALLANYVSKVLNYKEANVIFDEGIFGQTLSHTFTETAKKLGLEIKNIWHFDSKNPVHVEETIENMVSQLLSQDKREAIFVATHSKEGVEIVRSLRRVGRNFPIIGSDTFSSNGFINALQELPQERSRPGYYSDGIYATSPFLDDIGGEYAQIFKQAFIKRYKKDPTSTTAMYYDAVVIGVHAIEKMTYSESEKLSIQARRRLVRNNLWQLSIEKNAVRGVTGYLYFDEFGTAIRQIPVGFYRGGKLFVAPNQFQPIVDLKSVDNLLEKVLKNDIIHVNGKFMHKAKVVYTGIDFNEISDFNPSTSSFLADFYLWFRFEGDFDDKNIEFVNAVDSETSSGEAIITKISEIEKNMTIRAYRIKANFKGNFNFRHYPLDHQLLSIKFKHRELTRERLIYVVDTLGMNLNPLETSAEKLEAKKANTIQGWFIHQVTFFEDSEKNDSSLGMPESFNTQKRIEYSQFNSTSEIRRYVLSVVVKEMIPVLFIMALGYITFFMPTSDFGTRMSLNVNAILATLLFHLKLSSDLAVTYFMLIEYTFYVVYMLSLMCIAVSLIAFLHYSTYPKVIERLDLGGKILYFPIIIISFFIIFGKHLDFS
jgi:branched-chain amino acid transport system substrate-binding protein